MVDEPSDYDLGFISFDELLKELGMTHEDIENHMKEHRENKHKLLDDSLILDPFNKDHK